VRDLPSFLSAGDVLVVNDAATLPASFRDEARDVELRLLSRLENHRTWRVVLFGSGDFRTETERRPDPPKLEVGTVLELGEELSATIVRVDDDSPRLVDVVFDRDGAALFHALFRHGRPIQYAYVKKPVPLFHVQSRFAARPWAVEAPSAGRPLTWGTLTELRRRGVTIASITHAAGMSSTGGAALDGRLPVPERYAIPEKTRAAILSAKERGRRVIAVGTTVVRALEASALDHGGVLTATEGEAKLLIGPGFRPRVVDGLLSGMHPPGTSHFSLLGAFASRTLLDRALAHAEASGYLEHEFGDSCLVLPSEESVSAGALPG
jgi:S-adenosylmethionine:tRNA ribosyltransferase-isomerase